MQSGGATKPLLSSSGSGEPTTQAHRTHKPKHTFLRGSLPREFHVLSFSESFIAILTHPSIKGISLNAEEVRRQERAGLPRASSLSQKAEDSLHHRASRLEEGAKWMT